MEKTVIVDGKEVRMRASALIPRLYRAKFGRDLMRDMIRIEQNYRKATAADLTEEERQAAQLNAIDLLTFENVAWLMAYEADKTNVPDNPDEWLDGFEMFSIYEIMPVIMELWGMSNKTTSTPKKKHV